MKFVNRGEPVQVRIEVGNEYQWILLKTGKEIDLPEQQGINYGFERTLEAVKGKIGEIEVETKQIELPGDYTPDDLFFKELTKIKGIGNKTAEDIVEWGTKEKLIEYVKQNKKLPFQDNIEILLKKQFLKKEES